MTLVQAIFLGLIQGLAEFFPISSSAHMRLAKWCLGIPEGEHLLYFDLWCHAGTLLALLIFLRNEVFAVLKSPKTMAFYILALLPLIPGYFLLKPLRIAASNPAYMGTCFLVTSALLFAASRKKVFVTANEVPSLQPTSKWRDVLCIGMMQTLALIPGISRSGSTIAAARFCGWPWLDAARFSFLLAVPTILGGMVLEGTKSHAETASLVSGGCFAAGFLAAFGLGLWAVRFVFKIYKNGTVRPFAWYCLALGLITTMIHG